MSTIALTTETLAPAQRSTRMIWPISLVLIGCFYLIEHRDDSVSQRLAFTFSGEEMAALAAGGDVVRKLTFPALALFGVYCLLRREGRKLRLNPPLGWMMIAFLTWCTASILWSTDPPLTIRRVTVLILSSVAALGIARQIELRDLCAITLIVTTVLILNSMRTEIVLGTFRPWATDYRFSGTLHPNVQAPYCAVMAMSAACLATRAQRGRVFLWLLCLAGIGFLVLTKSRTVCGAFLAGLLVFNLFGVAWPKKMLVAAVIIGVFASVAWVGLLMGWDVERGATNVALIGRQEDNEALSGRIPLWSAVIPHLADHPLVGHGYQTFWNPARIESFTNTFQFLVPDGHSAYIDAAMDLGLIGAGFCLFVVMFGMRQTAAGYLYDRDLGYGFFLALLTCRSLNGLLESNFAAPTSFVPFIMVCGLAHLAFCPRTSDFSSPVDSTPEIES